MYWCVCNWWEIIFILRLRTRDCAVIIYIYENDGQIILISITLCHCVYIVTDSIKRINKFCCRHYKSGQLPSLINCVCVCTLCTRVSRDVVEGHHQYLTMRTKKNRRIIGIGHHYICEVERKKEHTKSHIRKNRDTSQFIRTVVGIVRGFIL